MSNVFRANAGCRDNVDGYIECRNRIDPLVKEFVRRGLFKEAIEALADVLQEYSCDSSRRNGTYLRNSIAMDYIMRGVSVALQDDMLDRGRTEYVIRNLKQGTDILETNLPIPTET